VTWAGRKVTTARAYWATRLPLPCAICRRPVDGTIPWVVEHLTPRSLGGSETDRGNQWVSHRTPCSNGQGARMGARVVNTRREVGRLESERARGIRGL
jgi:5-methylcytosine-specific restriction endonuclease McrA